MSITRLQFFFFTAGLLAIMTASAREEHGVISVTITPAATGRQLVRTSLPLPRGFFHEGETLLAENGKRKIETAVRPLSWHPVKPGEPKSARRVLVTFPFDFKTLTSVQFAFRPAPLKKKNESQLPVEFQFAEDRFVVKYAKGPVLKLRLLAPARTSTEAHREVVESNAFYRWERFHLSDSNWPRVIEVRADVLGEVVVIGHLQRNLPDDRRAPDFGWEAEIASPSASLIEDGGKKSSIAKQAFSHSYSNGVPCVLHFDGDNYFVYHPTAPLKRRGRSEAQTTEDGKVLYRYWRCRADERVPMQPTSWQRAEMVIAPTKLTPLTITLQSPHQIALDARLWDQLYATGPPLELKGRPELVRILKYHQEAIVHSMARGDDLGNVTSYADGQMAGGVFGMNRLNHCPPIFQEGWRHLAAREPLLETALLWCDNFYDQTIWWGEREYGGTRYNNVIARRQTPPDNDQTYMWRSDDSVNFCTKGYDSFWLAYEETGDPRMLEALEAQVGYATKHVHTHTGECRNIGDVREFVRLYQYTGEARYLEQALRLFRELRTKLSTGDLFDQGGKPLSPDLPFIDDDAAGTKLGYAKPYIIGYALTGLPELAALAPREPKLREVIAAVADFLAESQDPVGGWRYPHPRSSYVILSQGMEHAWQLVQADRFLGAQERHLDAIERVLRQRILGWQQTGKVLNGLQGWEITTGKIKDRAELQQLYAKPGDRDASRDYTEGRVDFGGSSPEGLVYFPEVLAFYLKHRPASRLMASPKADEPLAQALARLKKD